MSVFSKESAQILENAANFLVNRPLAEKDTAAGNYRASNDDDADRAFVFYVWGIVDRLMRRHRMTDDQAVEYVISIADDLMDVGTLPPFPDVDTTGTEVAVWTGAAQSYGLGAIVLNSAGDYYQ